MKLRLIIDLKTYKVDQIAFTGKPLDELSIDFKHVLLELYTSRTFNRNKLRLAKALEVNRKTLQRILNAKNGERTPEPSLKLYRKCVELLKEIREKEGQQTEVCFEN